MPLTSPHRARNLDDVTGTWRSPVVAAALVVPLAAMLESDARIARGRGLPAGRGSGSGAALPGHFSFRLQDVQGAIDDLAVGHLLVPGRESNFEAGRVMNYVYFTATLDAAVWGAELASGEGRGRVYIVEPTGEFEDDPNVTDRKFPGNPTRSFRSREPLRVVGELVDWVGHSPEKLEAMRAALDALQRNGTAEIED